jgi:hypothetical protein
VDNEEEKMAHTEVRGEVLGWSAGPTRLQRGVCGGCDQDRALRADGTMKVHQRGGAPCPGTGTVPTRRTDSRRLPADRERTVAR